jgi:hypothetical protein
MQVIRSKDSLSGPAFKVGRFSISENCEETPRRGLGVLLPIAAEQRARLLESIRRDIAALF